MHNQSCEVKSSLHFWKAKGNQLIQLGAFLDGKKVLHAAKAYYTPGFVVRSDYMQ